LQVLQASLLIFEASIRNLIAYTLSPQLAIRPGTHWLKLLAAKAIAA
jgi:hypothetical protein